MIRPAILALALGLLAACGRAGTPAVSLEEPPGQPPRVAARGLERATLKALARLDPRDEAWSRVLQVQVAPGAPPVSGRYALDGRVIRFIPDLSLQPGRPYRVSLLTPDLMVRTLTPAATPSAPARVTAAYPSGPAVPQNLLRLYVQFSAPMAAGHAGGLALLDDRGRALDDPFLPLGYEFWSPDRTRLTVLLDPGRVKRGVVAEPILETGRRYTLVVGRDWRDAHGRALASDYRRDFVVAAPERRAIDPAAWGLAAPKAGTREALRVEFGRPLDRALLLSAVGVEGPGGVRIAGRAEIDPGEAALAFTPDRPWTDDAYRLIAQPFLEDAAGNRPGRPFEANAKLAVRAPQPGLLGRPFRARR